MNLTRIIIGTIFVLLGITMLIDQLGFGIRVDMAAIFSLLWPMIFLGFGIKLLSERKIVFGLTLMLIGASSYTSHFLGWSILSVLWPLLIITAGVMILTRRSEISSDSSEAKVDATALFWGVERKVTSKQFKAANILCMFGGIEYDFTEAKLDSTGAEIEVNCFFGGVELKLPSDWQIENKVTEFLGVVDDATKTPAKKTKTVLRIKGNVAFGAIDIKN